MKRSFAALISALALGLSLAAPVRAEGPNVVRSSQRLSLDGAAVSAEAYNIDDSNYYRLRDVAMLLRETNARFSVDFDSAAQVVSLVAGEAYESNGSELKTGVKDLSASCTRSTHPVFIDGKSAALDAYNIGGNNFFKLRDLASALHFAVGYDEQTRTVLLDTSYYIDRMDLSEGYPVDMYYEIPVFYGDSAALRKINAGLAALRDGYAKTEAPNALETVIESMGSEYGPTKDSPYANAHPAWVFSHTDDLISLAIQYDWYMGGVQDYGFDCFNFNAKTGERIYLGDLIDGTDDEIREAIVASLLKNYPGVEEDGVMETPMDVIRAMSVRDIDFYVENGTVIVVFDKYEISYGAAGMFTVPLPIALKPLN